MAEAPPCTPSSWSDIPLDIAGLVLRLLPAHADLARFAAVCPKWRAAACAAAWQLYLLPPLPVISLPDGSFYSLHRGERFLFPDYGGRYHYHSTCGNWLVFSRDDGFFLVDPFSKATMTLPGMSCVESRWEADDESDDEPDDEPDVESDDEPDDEPNVASDDKELVMFNLIVCSPHLVAALVDIPGFDANEIVVCRPGASSWSMHANNKVMQLRGMAFHQGELYVLDSNNDLLAVDISVDHSTGDPWVSRIGRVIEAKGAFTNDMMFEGDDDILTMQYLVESHGALLMVCRQIRGRRRRRRRRPNYGGLVFVPTNSEFEVFEADLGRSRWNKVTTVGDDQVLFLARWYSRAVSVSRYGMPGNRIFFWDDDLYHDAWYIHHDRKSFSCSAYDMRNGTVYSPLPMISWKHGRVPPTWLFPRD